MNTPFWQCWAKVVTYLEADPSDPALGSVLQHEGEELGEGEEAAGRHGAERVQVALLHIQSVLPQLDAALKVPRVGVDGPSVADVVGRVRVRGPEDALSDQQRLHAHLVRVGDQRLQLLSRRRLAGAVVRQNRRPWGRFVQSLLTRLPQLHGSPPVAHGPQQIALLVHEGGPQQLQRVDALLQGGARLVHQVLHDVGVSGDASGQQRGHAVPVPLHARAALQQHLHDLQAAGLGAVVQSRVALHAAAVDVGPALQQEARDLLVALVAGDHQAGVSVPVGHLHVSAVLHQVAHDIQVSVEAGGAERCGVGQGGAVHRRSMFEERLHHR